MAIGDEDRKDHIRAALEALDPDEQAFWRSDGMVSAIAIRKIQKAVKNVGPRGVRALPDWEIYRDFWWFTREHARDVRGAPAGGEESVRELAEKLPPAVLLWDVEGLWVPGSGPLPDMEKLGGDPLGALLNLSYEEAVDEGLKDGRVVSREHWGEGVYVFSAPARVMAKNTGLFGSPTSLGEVDMTFIFTSKRKIVPWTPDEYDERAKDWVLYQKPRKPDEPKST